MWRGCTKAVIRSPRAAACCRCAVARLGTASAAATAIRMIDRLFTTASSFGNHPDGESGTVAQTEDIGDDIRGLTRLEDQVRHLRVGTRQKDAEGRRRHPGSVRDIAKSQGDVEGSRRLFCRLDYVGQLASLARKGMASRDIAFLCRRAEARCSESAGDRRRTSKPRHHNSATFPATCGRPTVLLILRYRCFVGARRGHKDIASAVILRAPAPLTRDVGKRTMIAGQPFVINTKEGCPARYPSRQLGAHNNLLHASTTGSECRNDRIWGHRTICLKSY